MKHFLQKYVISSLFVFFVFFNTLALANVEVILATTPLETNPNLIFKIHSVNTDEIILSREQFVISYNKVRRSANWVAWKLEADQIGAVGRTNNFSQDSELQNYLLKSPKNLPAVSANEYKGSCFDRGHQIPSRDRTDTKENNEATFLMSNMIPQTPYLNRVIWVHLEEYTRELVQNQGKKIYAITGPIYDQDFGKIGPNKDIPVPSKEFKVLFILDANQSVEDVNRETPSISVIMPNTQADGSRISTTSNGPCKALEQTSEDENDWLKYKTTLADVEKLSGLKILK